MSRAAERPVSRGGGLAGIPQESVVGWQEPLGHLCCLGGHARGAVGIAACEGGHGHAKQPLDEH